jgi:KaiC/GvpD/RAD55 family RecA-like ATPase
LREVGHTSELITVKFAPGESLEFPRGSQLLVVGPPGVVKPTLAIRYLCERLEEGEPCAYATTVWSPAQVRELAEMYCGKKAAAKLRIIDGVSCVAGKVSEEPLVFQTLFDLNSVNLTLLQASAELARGNLVVDSLSTLMSFANSVSVFKFLQVLSAKMKDRAITALYVLEQGVHDPSVVSALDFSLDGVIETRDFELSGNLAHLVRLAHVRGHVTDSRWLLFRRNETFQWLAAPGPGRR